MAAQLGLKKKQKQKRKATVAGADAPAVADSAAPEPEVVKKKAKRSAISGAQLAGEEQSSQQQQTADAAAGARTSEGTAVIDPAAHKKPRRCAPTRTARLSKLCMAPVQRAVVFCTEGVSTADGMAMQEEETGRCGGCRCQPRGARTPSLPAGAAGELANMRLPHVNGDAMQ